ncbi:RNA binding protein [Erwinia phage AH06]|nr:RNA binding protein [Erwinia phage AH06]
MSTLQLAVNGEYFDAMKDGSKVEEFRLTTPYWEKRLLNRDYDRLIITRGYPSRDDQSRRIDIPYNGYEVKTITHPHFGDQPVNVFAIKVNLEKS